MAHNIIHILLHFVFPALIALSFYKNYFWKAWAVMSITIIVDIDHILANPVFDPTRCSIGFHPLHSVAAIGIYMLMTFIPKSRNLRLAGIGLLIHMLIDALDCKYMLN